MVNPSADYWRILLVDDDEDDYILTLDRLKQAQGRKVELDWAATYQAGERQLQSNHYHAVLVDYDLGLRTGIEFIREATAWGYPAPLILFTGRGSREVDVEAMAAGAALYLTKDDVSSLSLERFIRYAIERHRIEQELDRRLQERSAILESIQDGLFGLDRDWRITYINSRAARTAGFEPEALTGRIFWEVFPGTLGGPLEESYRRAMAEGKPLQVEWNSPDHQRWYHISVYPSVEGISIYWQDITGRKEMEHSLRESEAQLRVREAIEVARRAELETIIDAVPAYIWITHDPQSREMTGNQASHELMRAPKGVDLSKTGPEADKLRYFRTAREGREIPAEDLPIQVAAATGRPVRDYEFDLIFDDGEVRHLLGNAVPLLDERGQPAGAVGAFIDITERKQAAEALRLSEEKFAKSFRSSPIALSISTVEEGRFIEINDSYSVLYGYSREEIIGHTSIELGIISPEDRKEIIRLFHEGGGFRNIELAAHAKSGEVRNVLFSTEPIEINSKGYMLSVIMDITERKRLEAEQREQQVQMEIQRRLLDYRDQERQALARDLHDGPVQDLSSLLFNVQFAKESISDPRIRVELEQIGLGLKDSVQHLREMINEMRPPSLIRFGLAKSMNVYLEEFRERHPEIELESSLKDDGDCLPEAVRLNLFRIVQESLNNATRHAAATRISVRLDHTDCRFILIVQDNGKGFSVKKSLVEYSSQGHYGLMGMKERTEAIGGELSVTSEAGKGTTIQVRVDVPGKAVDGLNG